MADDGMQHVCRFESCPSFCSLIVYIFRRGDLVALYFGYKQHLKYIIRLFFNVGRLLLVIVNRLSQLLIFIHIFLLVRGEVKSLSISRRWSVVRVHLEAECFYSSAGRAPKADFANFILTFFSTYKK